MCVLDREREGEKRKQRERKNAFAGFVIFHNGSIGSFEDLSEKTSVIEIL